MSLFLKDDPSRPRYAIEQNLSEVMMGSWGLVLKGTDGWVGCWTGSRKSPGQVPETMI